MKTFNKKTSPCIIITFILVYVALSCVFQNNVSAEVEAVYLTPHFHYDPVFEKPQNGNTEVGFDRCRRFLNCVKNDPGCRIVFSEIDYLKPFFDTFPEERDIVLKYISENRIETAGSYNEPNEMSVGGEGLIRNILYGRAYDEGVLGDRFDLIYQPFDVFGHTIQLSQILAKSRYIGAVWRKGNPPIEGSGGMTVSGLPPDFINLAPDGTLLHHRREHYKSVSADSVDDLLRKIDKKKRFQDSTGLTADFGLLSRADFAYPEPWLTGNAMSLRNNKPPVFISGPTAYFVAIGEQLKSGKATLPVISRDFSLYHTGTALSRVDLKIANRLSENILLSAEKFSVIAAVLGSRYPEPALDKAWRQLLFNQHHDGITGTCNDLSFFDMMAGFREASDLGFKAFSDSLHFIASRIDTSKTPDGAIPIVVFNPLGWKRTDRISIILNSIPKREFILADSKSNELNYDVNTVKSGRDIKYKLTFVAVDVPSVGYKTYYLVPRPPKIRAASVSASGNKIENEFYSITVDPARGGAITELIDKKTGRAVIEPSTKFPGNELIVLKEDRGPQYPAWELSTTGVKDNSSSHQATVKAEKNGAYAKLTVSGEIPTLGGYIQEITLYKGVKRIDFLTTILNPDTHKDPADRNFWIVRFPVKLNGTGPVIEDRFFAAARRRSLKPLNYRTDLDKMLTLSAPYSAMNWAEEGTAVRIDILDESGAVAEGIALELCEIVHTHSADSIAAAQTLQSSLITRGVTCTPSYDDEDRNKDLLNRNIRFVLDIGGDNKFAQTLISKTPAGTDFTNRLAAYGAAKLFFSPVTSDMEIRNVDTLIIGASNADKMKSEIQNISADVTNRMRIVLNRDEDARKAKKPSPPDDYGIALINSGNILTSFDSNGTIVMGLFHSAQWAGEQQGIPFTINEMKNHRYAYSLYPHEKDWRDARTYRAGHEFNTPLSAVQAEKHKGILPAEMSFYNIESDSVVLSAVKAAGNPYAAMKTSAASGPQNGIVLRLYEAEGKQSSAKIRFFKPVESVRRANLIEETGEAVNVLNGDTIDISLGPNAIETVFAYFKNVKPAASDNVIAGSALEPRNNLFSNYWMQNLGAAYSYNSPVTISLDYPLEKNLPDPDLGPLKLEKKKPIRKQLKKGTNQFRLVLSNNSTDTPMEGTLRIEAPDGLKPSFTSKAVTLAPLNGQLIELEVYAEKPPSGGFLRAFLNTRGKTYFAALPLGKHEPLKAEAAIIKNAACPALQVSIDNNQGGRIDGAVTIISPIETWPAGMAGFISIANIDPIFNEFSLAESESKVFAFNICGTAPEIKNIYSWLVAKITYNGDIKYIPIVLE